jgi:cardiolipin synthase A/B
MARAATLIALLLAPLAVVGAQHLLRRPPVRRVRVPEGGVLPSVRDAAFPALVEMHVRTPLLPGNRVEVLCDGDGTYPRMLDDLRAAERSILFQVFYAKPGALADAVGAVLRARAEAGVRVHFLYDAFGAATLRSSYLGALREAGVEVRAARPPEPSRLWELPHRSHVRCVSIDGRVGYTGGFGLADEWLGSGASPGEWRETNVRLEGPAARHFEAAFAAGWADAAQELLLEEPALPASAPGGARAGLLHLSPELGSTSAERFLALSLSAARERIWLSSAYFVPETFLSRLLCDAAARGVDVRVLTASDNSDVPIAYRGGRSRYAPLLESGVRIWEYTPAMMHAKTFVIDGRWCTIGGINYDNRSLALMDETTLMVLDDGVGAALERAFAADLGRSEEIRLEQFRRRPLHERAMEHAAGTVSRLL